MHDTLLGRHDQRKRVGRHPRRILRACLLAAALVIAAAAPAAATSAHTWYVRAGAAPGGSGTQQAPFDSLADVERVSRAGDTIVVVPVPMTVPPLDGGIALKPGQHLIGGGSSILTGSPTRLPRITNSTATRHSGDAVTLASGAEVTNLQIAGSYRAAVYGNDVSGVDVHGNDLSAFNTSCTDGFFIAPFTFPTEAPGVGAPLSAGLKNGFAGIMLDASSASGPVTVADNRVHDARCADGIDLRLSGTANLTATIRGNTVTRLNNDLTAAHNDHQSVLAIGMQTSNSSRLSSRLSYNHESYIGGTEADSEGFFGYPSDASHLTIAVDHNTMAHGIGGLGPNGRSANGMEFVILQGHPTASMSISDSSFYDAPGDLLEELNWGVNSTMHLQVTNVTASHSTGLGNTVALPFNNGDCLLESSAGSGTTTTLAVSGSHLSDCANNGLTVHNNVVNGSGPAKLLSFDVDASSITGNRGHNLRVANLTGLITLTGRTQGTDLSGSTATNLAFDQAGGTTTHASLDLGGGALGSSGNNCLTGPNPVTAETTGYAVSAEHDWWGSSTGPRPGQIVAVGGTVQTTPFLTTPAHCAP